MHPILDKSRPLRRFNSVSVSVPEAVPEPVAAVWQDFCQSARITVHFPTKSAPIPVN